MDNFLVSRRRSEDILKMMKTPFESLRTKKASHAATFYVTDTVCAMMPRRHECHPLDGVPVKITLRPPKAITVPSHFLKTDLPASLEQDYDFSLEYRVLQDSQVERERQAKLEALRPTTAAPAPVQEFTTLTPSQPSSSASPEENSPPTPSTNISVTEFEPEAFSPFDQVELQTINDLEELHSIFGGVKVSEPELKTNQKVEPHKVTSDLSSMKNLFDGEQLKRIGQAHSSAPSGSPYHYQNLNGAQATVSSASLPPVDPFKDLSKNLQTMAREISAMGFPAHRVALAVMDLGDDKDKVVDHLCLIEKLVDEGFEASDVSQALQFMSHDLTKSREFLKSMSQLTDLGFPKGDIAVALKLHNNDRDKALDELLKG